MRRFPLIVCAAVLPLAAIAGKAPEKSDGASKVIKRAVDLLIAHGGGYIYDIPPSPRRDEAGLARNCAKSMISHRDRLKGSTGDDNPMIIISDDPAFGARVAHGAFASLQRGVLRRMKIICILGSHYESYLRPVAIAAGARLQVEPIPK
jgi:hypothetical protein